MTFARRRLLEGKSHMRSVRLKCKCRGLYNVLIHCEVLSHYKRLKVNAWTHSEVRRSVSDNSPHQEVSLTLFRQMERGSWFSVGLFLYSTVSAGVVLLRSMALPQQLKPIQHYLRTAQEHEKRDPVVAYYCECLHF